MPIGDLNISQFNEAMWRESCWCWCIDHKIKNEKGDLIEFNNHPFLKDIYDDFTPVQVARKSAQAIGLTTANILKSFWAAKYRKWNIVYTMPSFQMVQDIASAKVNALIAQNPILGKWIKDKDSVFQKQVGNSFINYRGASSDKVRGSELEGTAGISLTSDLNIMDECDRSSQPMLEQYESRLENSAYKGKWYFSNPTHPNTLSQDKWAKSDQKHWFIKCNNGHWQYLDYWKNVKDYKFICEKCGIEITDDNRRKGQWVKKYPGREISGYWLPHLIVPTVSAKQIQEAYENKTKQYFYNFVLGLPYIGSDVVVNRDIILRNIDLAEPNFQEHNVLGVDQGLQKYWVLGNRQGIFAVGQTEDWHDIEELIRVYDIETAVFDALPDLTEPRKLRDKYPGKVWLNYYKKEVRKADFILKDFKTHTIYSDRSKLFGQVIDEMVYHKIRFQMKKDELGEYIRHWETLYRTEEKDSLDIPREIWNTSGDDHYAHATLYWRLALGDIEGETAIKEWRKQEIVHSDIAPSIKQQIEEQEQYE